MYNTEEIGISAEVAIATAFGVPLSPQYQLRSNQSIISHIQPIIQSTFLANAIPIPSQHIAEGQNPVDFYLTGNKTLSVKTNQKQPSKVAPQRVGQASSKTFFLFFSDLIDTSLVPVLYSDRVILFKTLAFARIDHMLKVYWDNLFDCDYLIYIYDILQSNGSLSTTPKSIVFSKKDSPVWDINAITFTKPSLSTWNESNTVKYHGVSIGEFQVHNNRDNFKFRFNMAGITKLTKQGII